MFTQCPKDKSISLPLKHLASFGFAKTCGGSLESVLKMFQYDSNLHGLESKEELEVWSFSNNTYMHVCVHMPTWSECSFCAFIAHGWCPDKKK